jgi:glycosyl transferase family 10 (putative fucosyltransferase)
MILFYNQFFASTPLVTDLEPRDLEAFSWDRSLFADAAAVVFHVPDLILGTPNLRDFFQLQKTHGQMWVAWSMESAVNYPVLSSPAFLSRFDLVMTYARTADIWSPYYPRWASWTEALRRPLPAKTEDAPVAMFQSASHNKSHRIEFARELMSNIQVDSYGQVLKNRSLAEGVDQRRTTKLETIARYKFCLALENVSEIDYVTEKFFDPLLVGTVPVYRGAPNVSQFAPGNDAFINAADFSSPRELALYLKELASDDEAYRRYLRWRQEPLFPSFQADLDALRVPVFRKLVEIVRSRRIVDRI